MLFDEPDRYYAPASDRYYQQGDVVLAPVCWIDGDDRLTSPEDAEAGIPVRAPILLDAQRSVQATVEAVLCPAMITTHDCSLDKEFSRRFHELRALGRSVEVAERQAAADDSLDRMLAVAPVVPLEEAAPSAPAQLGRNEVIGYFPVCESNDRSLDEGVVDLLRQTTIDRGVIIDRLGILSQDARATLIYALARFYAYRAPKLTYELEAAIGKRIVNVELLRGGALGVALTLNDGGRLDLLQAPPGPTEGGPERSSL